MTTFIKKKKTVVFLIKIIETRKEKNYQEVYCYSLIGK